MKFYSVLLVCVFTFACTGCGGGADNDAVIKTDYDPAVTIKESLAGIKTSGRLGSNFGGVMAAVQDMKKTDPAKGEAIEKALNEMTSLKDAAKMKAKAEEIIKQL
jgi:hypothetical protein